MAHGQLVDGVWKSGFHNTKATGGRFQRGQPAFRNWVTPDGSAGPSGSSGFPAERGRYHLYVSLACPWAHRTVIFRRLKGLEDVISMDVVEPVMGEGWEFGPDADKDSVNGKKHLHEVYALADPHYTGRVSVPVLWDKERRTIVNNESPEIIRMLNSAFNALTNDRTDYYPAELRGEIDTINETVFRNVNNGVYRCGFATSQEAYEAAYDALFARLDVLEERLAGREYLLGDTLREVDIRLFTTLVRFDAVYHGHFKCNRQKLTEFPNLWAYARRLYQLPGFGETVDFDQIKRHYYVTHDNINPTGIVPKGPDPRVWLS
jgi:putative glutathione S-transferase